MKRKAKKDYKRMSYYANGVGSLGVGNYHRAAMFFMEGMNKSPLYEERVQCKYKFLAAVAMDAEQRC